ncbi:MAG: hypothetical protein H6Q87_489, partial [candidate division NC10 bacterium]|nr:hypothetical protein [candidate division NC10 bacterium]
RLASVEPGAVACLLFEPSGAARQGDR